MDVYVLLLLLHSHHKRQKKEKEKRKSGAYREHKLGIEVLSSNIETGVDTAKFCALAWWGSEFSFVG
jgi:hypothetical protein